MLFEGDYPDKLKKSILSYNKWINKIENFEWILGINYTEERLKNIKDLIKNKKIDALIQMKLEHEQKGDADLTVVKFNDQNDAPYLAIIYDTLELWDDPMVLDVYPI